MRVVGLTIYPVKSASRVEVDSAVALERGFRHDRRWMLVDEEGKFVTQRKVPSLATLIAQVENTGLELSHGDQKIMLAEPDDESIGVEVWGDEVDAFDAGEAASAWLTERFGTRLNLVWMAPQSLREVGSSEVSFADGYPYLLTTMASLEAVREVAGDIGMERFRPNIVIDGDEAFAEHGWARIRIGEAVFDVVKPCARCVVTTVDQDRGTKTGTEPLASLATINKIDSAACFGENLVVNTPGATLRVGDEVEVLESRA